MRPHRKRIQFEIEIKNIVLVALRTFEFSHGLDPFRKSAASGYMQGQYIDI
jgi:hypothetical protein